MHQDILSYLAHAAKKGALAHAHALIGPQGSGRMELLGAFLKDFFQTKSLAHPDIRIIEPVDDVISISTIRQARLWLSMTPISSDKKALIILGAERMNKESQNAFLKILEEPAQNTFIFLLASHRKRILATFYSRVVARHFAGNQAQPLAASPNHLIHSLLAATSTPERMRVWLAAGIAKEDMRSWLTEALPRLRAELREGRSKTLAEALRNLIQVLARPQGANWQLALERLIISL